MYIDGSVKKYLADLSARLPAPGGGSAAALSASLGVSLMSMVANYTVGNSKYKSVEAKAADILVRTSASRVDLERLIDTDCEAYNSLSKAMKELGKGSPALDDIYKKAAAVPFEICKITANCLKLCKELARIGNKNLVTDTAIAAIFLEGAFFSAKYNVYINLRYIKDMKYIEDVHKVLAPLENSMPKLKEEILEMCEEVIEK